MQGVPKQVLLGELPSVSGNLDTLLTTTLPTYHMHSCVRTSHTHSLTSHTHISHTLPHFSHSHLTHTPSLLTLTSHTHSLTSHTHISHTLPHFSHKLPHSCSPYCWSLYSAMRQDYVSPPWRGSSPSSMMPPRLSPNMFPHWCHGYWS